MEREYGIDITSSFYLLSSSCWMVCVCLCVLMGDELAKCHKRQRKHTHIHIVVERKCQLMSKKKKKKEKTIITKNTVLSNLR